MPPCAAGSRVCCCCPNPSLVSMLSSLWRPHLQHRKCDCILTLSPQPDTTPTFRMGASALGNIHPVTRWIKAFSHHSLGKPFRAAMWELTSYPTPHLTVPEAASGTWKQTKQTEGPPKAGIVSLWPLTESCLLHLECSQLKSAYSGTAV